jgi:hypothetical protein
MGETGRGGGRTKVPGNEKFLKAASRRPISIHMFTEGLTGSVKQFIPD